MKKIGRQVLFLKTGSGNPRNGEGSFLRRRDGSILFGYTEYTGESWNDHASARLSYVISRDEGESWGEKGVLLEKPEKISAKELANSGETKKAVMRARAEKRMDEAVALIVERIVKG